MVCAKRIRLPWGHKQRDRRLRGKSNCSTETGPGNLPNMKKKYPIVRAILICFIVDDLIYECEQILTAHDIWTYLREKYSSTSMTRLRRRLLSLIFIGNLLITISHSIWELCLLWLENWSWLVTYSLMSNTFRLWSTYFLILGISECQSNS